MLYLEVLVTDWRLIKRVNAISTALIAVILPEITAHVVARVVLRQRGQVLAARLSTAPKGWSLIRCESGRAWPTVDSGRHPKATALASCLSAEHDSAEDLQPLHHFSGGLEHGDSIPTGHPASTSAPTDIGRGKGAARVPLLPHFING